MVFSRGSGAKVDQLSGMDNVFLAAETDRTPMHVTAVLTYEPPADTHENSVFERVRAQLSNSLDKSPVFRRRLIRAPLRYDHPYWADDETFDLDNHVDSLVLPKPGNWEQFCSAVTHLHSRPLNLDRPLWEAHVIEGIDAVENMSEGSFAIVIRMHHAAIDGVSGTRIIAALHTPAAESPSGSSAAEWQPARRPSSAEMMWNSYLNYLQRSGDFWQTVNEVVPALRKARSKLDERPALMQSFQTRFNAGVTRQRHFDSVALDIDKLKHCRGHVPGSTLNDVVVSIVGGGLRRYLLEKDELGEESLVAGAPINIRDKDDSESAGNLISMMRIPLGTDVGDPVERLRAVNAGSLSSKAYARKMGLKTLTNVAQSLNPQLLVLGVRAVTSELLNDIVRTPVHTVVTTVPGPRFDMFLGSARLTRVMGLGPLVDQVGLFHAVTSVASSMSISFVCCPESMPDPGFYRECLESAYEELLQA